MKNRIKELRAEKGMRQTDLANLMKISQSTLSYWEIGRFDIDTESLSELAKIFDVSIDYLLCRTSNPSTERTSPKNIMQIKTKKVPLLGTIACGQPIYAEEQHGEFVSVSDDVDCDFCLRASGDSMTGARIHDGDIVFIRSAPTVPNGKIAAVAIDDEATLKRIYFYPDKQKLMLVPENPEYEPMVFIGEELSQVRVLGQAVAFQSLVK